MSLKENSLALSNAWFAGGRGTAMDIAEQLLSPIAQCERLPGGLTATIKGRTDRTILFDAHIDEIALFVTAVNGGFVKVAAAGGFDSRMLPATRVVIHGKKDIIGVFCSTPPHLIQEKSKVQKLDEMYIDTLLLDASEFISVGDAVTFAVEAVELSPGVITGKAFDDRVACAVLIEVENRISGMDLPCNVCISLSDAEEIGSRGAKTTAYAVMPDEAVTIDVGFANGPDIPPEKSGKPGGGVMLGISPILDCKITELLKNICNKKQLPFQMEVTGGTTSTNADAITVTAGSVPTGLCSIPLRNMHTTVETVWMKDLETVVELLTEYALRGGVLNA